MKRLRKQIFERASSEKNGIRREQKIKMERREKKHDDDDDNNNEETENH